MGCVLGGGLFFFSRALCLAPRVECGACAFFWCGAWGGVVCLVTRGDYGDLCPSVFSFFVTLALLALLVDR